MNFVTFWQWVNSDEGKRLFRYTHPSVSEAQIAMEIGSEIRILGKRLGCHECESLARLLGMNFYYLLAIERGAAPLDEIKQVLERVQEFSKKTDH